MQKEFSTADLIQHLANGSQWESMQAAKELARRNERSVLPAVANVLTAAQPGHAREMAAWLLGELSPGTDDTLNALCATISDSEAPDSLKGQAIESLGNQVSHLSGGETYERVADVLLGLLKSPSVEILYNAVFALGTLRCHRARSELQRIAAEDHRPYNLLETVSQTARFAIECIDLEPRGVSIRG